MVAGLDRGRESVGGEGDLRPAAPSVPPWDREIDRAVFSFWIWVRVSSVSSSSPAARIASHLSRIPSGLEGYTTLPGGPEVAGRGGAPLGGIPIPLDASTSSTKGIAGGLYEL